MSYSPCGSGDDHQVNMVQNFKLGGHRYMPVDVQGYCIRTVIGQQSYVSEDRIYPIGQIASSLLVKAIINIVLAYTTSTLLGK